MGGGNYKTYRDSESVPTTRYFQHPTKPGVFYPVHRRSLRHPDIDYSSERLRCFVTFNVQRGCGVVFAGAVGAAGWQALRDALARTGCTVHAACLMPDHVHLLVSPSGQGETVSDLVARTKSWMCQVVRRDFDVVLRWQSSFYDHCLHDDGSTEEEFLAIAAYIRQNPDRAGLSQPYPYVL